MNQIIYPIPENMVHLPCWCGSEKSYLVCDKDMRGQDLKTVQCLNCGTLRLDPRMSQEQTENYYKKDYGDKQRSLEENYEEQKKKRVERFLLRFIKKDMPVLDYGCGPGGKLDYFIHNGYDVHGFDVNEESMAFAESKGLKPMPLNQYERPHYGTLYFSHVLEHVHNPLKTLAEFSYRFRPGDTIIVELPFLERFFSGSRDSLAQDIRIVHAWYFSVGALDRLMAKLNFQRCYTNHSFLSVYRYEKSSYMLPCFEWEARWMVKLINLSCKWPIRSVLWRLNQITNWFAEDKEYTS